MLCYFHLEAIPENRNTHLDPPTSPFHTKDVLTHPLAL